MKPRDKILWHQKTKTIGYNSKVNLLEKIVWVITNLYKESWKNEWVIDMVLNLKWLTKFIKK